MPKVDFPITGLGCSTIHLQHSVFQALLFIRIRQTVIGNMCDVFADALAFRVYSILYVLQSALGSRVMLISSWPSTLQK